MLADRGAELYSPDLSCFGRAAPFMPPDVMSILTARVRLPEQGSEGGDPLFNAVSSGSTDTVKLVLDRGCNINARDRYGKTPLFYASCKEIACLLIASGASPDVRDSEGLTPLHEARDVDAAAVLIDQGIDVNSVSNEGKTPLHCACSADIVIHLLQRGASIEARDRYGCTPLFRVNTDAAAALLDRGADIDVVNSFGDTALHDATVSGSLEKAELLVNRGAGINIVNKKGETPYDKSQYESENEWKWKSRDRVGRFLQSRGGKSGDQLSR
jgi:ankyrin repeat protein